MMNLAEYRNRNSRLADFLPWVALIGSGLVLNKDGSFQRSARFRGPDLDSAVAAELVAVAGRLNNAFRRLGSGWAIFVEAQRHPSNHYPDSHFPDAASALVEPSARPVSRKLERISSPATSSPSPTCRRPRMPPVQKAGSMRAVNRGASIRTRLWVASPTAPTGFCASSKPSCPNAAGSMTAKR
jgi:hypothetical protein